MSNFLLKQTVFRRDCKLFAYYAGVTMQSSMQLAEALYKWWCATYISCHDSLQIVFITFSRCWALERSLNFIYMHNRL